MTPSFQTEVDSWMDACFGTEIKADRLERCDRFIEEALELCQTEPSFTADRAHALVDYVFGRPVGEAVQEVGGVTVTLAALCNAFGIDLTDAAAKELARVWMKVEAIRAKQAAKPRGSALPVPVAAPSIRNPARWFYSFSFDAEWWFNGGETREECIAAAAQGHDPIWIIEAKRMLPDLEGVVLADNVIENIQDQECWGEDGWEGFDAEKLQRRLDETIANWFAECCSLDGAQLDFIHGPEKIEPAVPAPALLRNIDEVHS